MRTDEFDYALPEARIAQQPARPRDHSRLMRLPLDGQPLSHHLFSELPDLLQPGDGIVVNNTRVIRARLLGRKRGSGGRVELLLLDQVGDREWIAMVGGKSIRPGLVVEFNEGLSAEVLEDLGDVRRRVLFDRPLGDGLENWGQVPLPPYIHRELDDPSDYQTVFAREPGSAAAPTAGLHFTPNLLQSLEAAGVSIFEITLQIGLDTFAPVAVEDPTAHPIHSEWCMLSRDTAESLNDLRASGGRLIAVGTTVVRTLETAGLDGRLAAHSGPTDLFILPGHSFQAIDGMLTNFHLPRSTLLMLVCAFAGRERVLGAYETAIGAGYRFYSFGDAMLIL